LSGSVAGGCVTALQVGREGLVWADDGQGFVAVGVSRDEMEVRYYTVAKGLEAAHTVTILPSD
jgi:hypothetical protein